MTPASFKTATIEERNLAWAQVVIQAARLSGSQVVQALDEISEEIWEAGLDHAFSNVPLGDPLFEARAHAFDIEWMTRLAAKLTQTEKEGWVMVPREPTPEMLKIGNQTFNRRRSARLAWEAMLSAATSAQAEK